MRAKRNKSIAFIVASMILFTNTTFASSQTVRQEKLIGETRYETAVEVSKLGWTQSKTAIIVNGNYIPSALCATPFAKLKNAPILLVNNNTIEGSTKNELKRLGVENVYIVDSGNTISQKVENEIKSLNININKITGNNIYEMSTNVAKEMDKISKIEKIAVVNGEKGLSDAVSIASPAAMDKMPIILVSKDNSNQASIDFLKNKNIEKSYIVGGEFALPENVVKNYPNKERLNGSDRNETNAKIINKFYGNKEINNVFVAKDGMGKEHTLVDALSIGVLAAKENSPILISNGNLVKDQKEFIKSKNIKEITQVGGGNNQKAFEEILKEKGQSIRNNTKKITLLQAKDILKKQVPGGTILVCYYDKDDNEYDGKIVKDNYIYEIEIDAYDGKILDIDKERIEDDKENNSGVKNISLDKAKAIMLDAIPGGNIVYCKYDIDDNEYEGEVSKDNKTYEIELSGFDGRIIEIDVDNDNDDDDHNDNNNNSANVAISADKAKQIMLAKVPGATIVKFEYDNDDKEYEAELRKGNVSYDIKVSAVTGNIVDFEIED